MSTTPQARLRPFQPTSFGGYILVSPLATGGMGELFLARKEGTATPCVIKKILPHLASGPDLLQRFIHEAKALVQLAHGSIARVLDMGIQDDRPYLVLEYVDGKDLRKVGLRGREREKRFPPGLTLYVMSRVLDALAYAHNTRDDDGNEIQLVHRDVSPPNILISYEGEVKVVDFGLAKSTLHNAKTHPSLLLGKFLYMSPEQARHQPVDRRSDLYSVGVCLYEMLLGSNPFDGLAPAELMGEITQPTFLDRRPLEGRVPDRVAAVVRRALALEPHLRFPTAESFREELLACLHDLDAGAGPGAVSSWMKEAFAAEYAAERRLLRSAVTLNLPPGKRETGIYRVPGHPTPDMLAARSHPTPDALASQRPTPLAVQAGSVPPPQSAEVVPLSFAPVPRTHLSTDSGPVTDAPTSPGSMRGEPETQPELRLDAFPAPQSDAPAHDAITQGPQKVQDLSVLTLRKRSRSAMWLLAPLLVGLSGLASYLGWDLYRTGFFRAPGVGNGPAWDRAREPAEPNEDELAPLVTSLGPGASNVSLKASWGKLRRQFDHFQHARGCTGQVHSALCQRERNLGNDVQGALERGEDTDEELLGRIRELSRDLADADRIGR